MWLLVKAPLVAIITLTISKSKIFLPMREFLKERSPFLGGLSSCPYCLLHWTAASATLFDGPIGQLPLRAAWLMVVAACLMALVKKAIDKIGG